MRQHRFWLLLLALAVVLLGCSSQGVSTDQELVVYSGRNERLILPIIEAFAEETGVKVVLRTGSGTELAAAAIEEQEKPRADVILINDAGLLGKLAELEVLAPNDSDALQAVPAAFKANDGSWTALTLRNRVIMYNKALVAEGELPTSLFDLTDPKWQGQVAMANGTNDGVIANVAGLRLVLGHGATADFLTKLKQNEVALLGGHTDVRKAVGRGEFKLGFVNSYYYHLQANEPDDNQVGVVYPDQGPGQMGLFTTISGVGLIKGAPHPELAKSFIDWLLTPEAQKLYAELNYEVPIVAGVPVAPGVKPLSELKLAPVDQHALAAEIDETTKLIDQIGLVTK